ncbi:MAG: prepilin-type N-terminal cleavage/methylation domain-containing protein [Deltaproteobacteria bacterium]|nr:prepilin-type N-terminal cleavage/methylation domain-containing protein [Deltaproteobacteria bacterium]
MFDHKNTDPVQNINCSGFTLMELVLVVLLIGILAQIGLSYMVNFQARTKDSIAIHDGRNLLTSVETSFANREVVDYEHAPADGRWVGAPTVFTLNRGVLARITAGSQSDGSEGTGTFEAWLYHSNGTDDSISLSGKREFYYFIDQSLNIYSLPSF